MNLANRITIARILMVPIFLVFLLCFKEEDWASWVCVIIFVIAAATDGVDGYVARKYNMITNFGKFIDPLADKILVTAALVGLVELGSLPSWVAIVIISREFIVTSLRIVAISEGKVIAAGNWGKAKTVSQIVMIVAILICKFMPIISGLFIEVSIYAAVALTLYSGFDYFRVNIKLIDFK